MNDRLRPKRSFGLGLRSRAYTFDNNPDNALHLVFIECVDGKGGQHCLSIYPEQNQSHEIGIFVPANGPLVLAED